MLQMFVQELVDVPVVQRFYFWYVMLITAASTLLHFNYAFLHSGYKRTSTRIGTERRADQEAL
jgi:hypothetical protein